MKRFKGIALAALAVIVAVGLVLPAATASAQSSAALSIVPKKNYTIEPGDGVKDTLTIRNLDGERELALSLRVVDFTFNDDTGTPKLMLAEDAPQTTWSLRPFLKVPESVVVPPKSSKSVDINIDIPAGQGAGSYYSAIVYSSGAPDGGNVGLSASGVTLVFTSIPGEVNEKLTLEKFGAYMPAAGDKKAGYTFFTMKEPQMLAYTLKNEGNVTESPVGSIILKDMFGNERNIADINPNKSLALIGQTRTFTACIKLKNADVQLDNTTVQSTACTEPGLWPGIYSATLDLYYGQNGNRTQDIKSSTVFWYFPGWFIILFFAVLGILAFYIWKIYRKIKTARENPSRRSIKISSSRRRR